MLKKSAILCARRCSQLWGASGQGFGRQASWRSLPAIAISRRRVGRVSCSRTSLYAPWAKSPHSPFDNGGDWDLTALLNKLFEHPDWVLAWKWLVPLEKNVVMVSF